MLQFTYDYAGIPDAAYRFWQWAHAYRVILFSGTPGAGKTTFISAVCDLLSVEDAVSSPTFALINEYRYPRDADGYGRIQHMDWYRLSGTEEAIHSGMEDALLDELTRIWVEWPEQAPDIIPAGAAWIQIEMLEDGKRQLTGAIR